MKIGIGRAGGWPWLLDISYWFLVISLLTVLLRPQGASAASKIDFSQNTKFFKELKVGERISGSLQGDAIPNPYTEEGNLAGFRLEIPGNTDPKNLQVQVRSCGFQFGFICIGEGFKETIYVFSPEFEPIGKDFKHGKDLELVDLKESKNRTLYLLVGSETATGTGNFVISFSLKNAAK